MTPKTQAKHIREMLQNNCMCVWHEYDLVDVANRIIRRRARVQSVRVRKGGLEVKHLDTGAYYAVLPSSVVSQL